MTHKAISSLLAAGLVLASFAAVSRADFSSFAGNVEDEQAAQEKRQKEANQAPKPKPKPRKEKPKAQQKPRSNGFSITMTKPSPKPNDFPRGSAEADYAAIYKGYLASNNNDVNVDAVAVDYYEVFAVPSGKIGGNSQSADCRAYANRWKGAKKDPGTRDQLLNEARVLFQQGRRNAQDAPKTVKVRMKTTGTLGPYDRAAKAFSVEVRPVPPYIRAPRSICQVSDQATKGKELAPRGRFNANIQGGNVDRITMLPMSQARADAYLRSHPKRDVDFIVLAQVGPIKARGGKLQLAPVRFVSAKAMDSKNGRTLHAYGSDALAGAAVAAADPTDEVWGADGAAAGASTKQVVATPTTTRPAGPTKIEVTFARASSDYSGGYDAQKSTDANLHTYWSTRSGAVLDIALDYFFGSTSRVSRLRIYSPIRGASYAVPRILTVTFYGPNDKRLGQQQVTLNGPYDQWQEVTLRPTDGVLRVELRPTALTKDIVSYATIHELEFHSW